MNVLVTETDTPAVVPVVKGAMLSRGTLLSRDLIRLARFCESVLGLESVRLPSGKLALRDRRTQGVGEPFWFLEVSEVKEISMQQTILNHWGVTVDSRDEVDNAYKLVTEKSEIFGLTRVTKPGDLHGSYCFYIADADSNWWEIEYRAPGSRYSELEDSVVAERANGKPSDV